MILLAKTLEGLEDVLAQEITKLGGENIKKLKRAVSFEGDKELMYKANIMLRTALRILVIKKEFTAKNENHLYSIMYDIPWENIMSLKDTFAVDATTSGEIFTHSKYTSLRCKDAIVDRFRDLTGKRPNVNVVNPTYRINIHIRNNRATLSLDSSGGSLHMRGYRLNTIEAPINEVLAAGLLSMTGWKGDVPLVDPMCGSGTILIEAARMALNHPTQKEEREFSFKRWRSYDRALYTSVYKAMTENIKTHEIKIIGQDKSLRGIKVTQQNIEEAGLQDSIKVLKKDFFKFHKRDKFLMITNPPYDQRLKERDIEKFYFDMGEKIKRELPECEPWIFSAAIDALYKVDMQRSQTFTLMNGGLLAKLINYDNS